MALLVAVVGCMLGLGALVLASGAHADRRAPRGRLQGHALRERVVLSAALGASLLRGKPHARSSRLDKAEIEREFKAQIVRERKARRARERWLESPSATAVRLRSRMAFHGLDASAAEGVLVHQFGGELRAEDASPAASVADAGRVVRYLGDFHAIVLRPDGERLLFTSTAPLRTSAGPVDLRLRADGRGFSPVRSAVALSIGDRLSTGVTVGSGVGLVLEGARSSGRLAARNSVFYPDVATDTDAADTPTADGVDLSTVLRSRLSPQVLRYRLVLPRAFHARAVSGGVVVYRGSDRVLAIAAPSAEDSQGTPVAVLMRLVGDQLVLTVRHRRMNIAYPVLVDPEITVPSSSSGWAWYATQPGWEQTSGGPPSTAYSPECPGVPADTPTGVVVGTASSSGPGQVTIDSGNYAWTGCDDPGFWAGWNWSSAAMGLSQMSYVELDDVSFSDQDPSNGGDYEYWLGPAAGPSGGSLPDCNLTTNTNDNLNPGAPAAGTYSSGSTDIWQGDCGTDLMELSYTEDEDGGNSQLQVGSVLVGVPYAPPSTAPDLAFLYGGGPQGADPGWHTCIAGEPVECATGDLYSSHTDLSLSGRGLPFALTRTYDAQAAVTQTTPGSFGYGWASSFSDQLVFSSETIPLCWSDCPDYSGGSPSGPTTIEAGPGWQIQQDTDGDVYEYIWWATVVQSNGSEISFFNDHDTYPAVSPNVQATLAANSDGTYTYTLPDQQTELFSSAGKLLSESDRYGNTLTMGYDSSGNLTSVTDGAGRSITFVHNSNGTVSSASGPMGTVLYGYDSNDNLTSVTDLDGGQWLYQYDSSHRLTSETDPLGHTSTTTYNTANQVVSQTDAMGRKWSWSYPQDVPQSDPTAANEVPAASETIITDPAGNQTDEWFEDGLPVSVTAGYGTPSAATKTMAYDQNLNLVKMTDADGNTWSYGYDSSNNLTFEDDPLGNVTTWTYDGSHDVTSETDPLGNTTNYSYQNGELTSVSRSLTSTGQQQTTSYGYDSDGDLTSMTDPDGNTWQYGYDAYGDQISSTAPGGEETTWSYDQSGYLTSMVSPRGNALGANPSQYTTTYVNDAYGRPTQITSPLGDHTEITYDLDGNETSDTDADGNTTTYGYDADNELTKTTQPNGTTLQDGYDADGNLTSQTDGAGHTTNYGYDAFNELSSVTDPLSRETTYGYDPDGNLTSLTDPQGRTTTYGYDADSELTSISYSDGTTPDVTYSYDADGNRTSMTDGTGITYYGYDSLGRLLGSTDGAGNTISYGYDLANNLTTITYPDGSTVTRSFDADERLASVTDWLGNTTTFGYDPDSNLTTITFPSGTGNVDTYTYDHADQISGVQMTQGTTTLASLGYTREPTGALASDTETGLPEPALTGTRSYNYDNADNLTKIEGTNGYSYDQADELTASPGYTYTYDQLGERTAATPTDGNPTSYGYDQAGELTTYTPSSGTPTTYSYDGDGLRTSKTTGNSTSQFTWDQTGTLPLVLTDGTNSYIYGPDNVPIEQINQVGTPSYLHHDQLGSIRLITDQNGNASGSFTYTPYGVPAASTGTTTTPFGYAGQYTDQETGLQYDRARYYDPQTGQFTTRDPLAAVTGQPYAYAGASPTNGTDPSGQSVEIEGGGDPITIQDILDDPTILENLNPTDVQVMLGGVPANWEVGTLNQGEHAGQGWALRETTDDGNYTGAYIRWHPGGGHHGDDPYWRVSDGTTKSDEVPAGKWPQESGDQDGNNGGPCEVGLGDGCGGMGDPWNDPDDGGDDGIEISKNVTCWLGPELYL